MPRLPPPPSPGLCPEYHPSRSRACGAFIRAKIAPLAHTGRLDAETAAPLPDALSFIDGLRVRLVLQGEGSVSRLSRNLERFLCRIVKDGGG